MRTTSFVRSLLGVGLGLGLLLATAPVAAHHAFAAEFDASKVVTMKGTVTGMEWINPHAWVHISVKDKDGKPVEWAVELGPPNGLYRRGWTKNTVPLGMEIVVTGFLAKDGSNKFNGRDAQFPDGRSVFVGSEGTGAPEFEKN